MPPETVPAEYTGGISDAGVKNLKEFVNNGGMLVCFDNACDMAIKEFNLPLRNTLEGVKSSEFYCPGSIVALDVDTKHPVAALLPNSFRRTSSTVRRLRRRGCECARHRAVRERECAAEWLAAR
jgi:hypothetical protein